MSSYFDHESLNIDSNKNSTTAESRLYIISPTKKNENLRKNNSKYSVDKLINDNRDSSSESKINNNNNNNNDLDNNLDNNNLDNNNNNNNNLDNNNNNNNNNNSNIYNYKDISNVPDNPANYPILGLVRFGPIPWVNFGTAKFIRNNGPTFERILLLRNPTSANINVHFSSPDKYSGFDLSTLDYDVPPNSIIPMKIFWKPAKIGNVRQNLTVKFNEIRLKCVLFATGTEKIGVKDVEVKTEFYTGIDKETGERKVQVSSLILQNETDCISEILRTKERRIRESSKESFRGPQQTKVENLPEIKDFSENNPCKIRRVNTKPIETTTITTTMKTTAETKEKEHLIEALRTKNQSFIINNNSSKNNVKYRKLYPKMPFRRSSSVNTSSASATKNSIDFLSNSSEDTSQTISLNRLARQALSIRNKGESTSKTTRSQGIQGPFTKKHRASSANSANTDLRISREFLGNAIRSLSSNSPDERAAEKQQAAFTTWINYMFKNEADSETEKPLSKFNKKTLTPKVLVILKKRNKMRLCVQKYFQDQRKYLSHVYEEIELGKLAIADEKFIYEDLGIRQAVLNLLLNYVPEYLQLGLEVMFNTIISIPINTQEYEKVLESALGQFITKEFLFDRTLAEKYQGHVKCFYREGFKETLEKLILNRILTLFWLLDRLKIRGFLDNIGVPYLFKKESTVKSSNQMCSLFMNSYLKCEGEVMRHLSKLNYHLYYQQSSVDEFDFRVNDLTVDLCDGIRLARLGDILSQKLPKGSHIPTKSNKNGILTIPGHGNPCEGFKYHSLNSSMNTSTHSNDFETISHIDNPHFFEENSRSCLSSLRIPVHSRLQKIHNTNLAFNQLHACGVPVVNFDSKDIVDANRNKILLLLWSIILHCEIPILLSENCLYDEVSSLKSIINKSEHSEILKKCLTSQSEPNSCIGYNNSLFPLLLEWTQLICAHFNYIVQNFTYSFSDGQAFCYLIAYYVPEILDSRKIQTNTTSALLYEKITDGENSGLSPTLEKKSLPKSERSLDGNWIGIFSPPHDTSSTTKQALEAEYSNYKLIRDSTKKIGYVPYILRALDMSNTIPDEKVVILFLSYLFPRLIQVQKERQAAIVLQKIIRNWQKKDTLGVTHASIAIQRVYRGFRSRKIFAGKRQAAQTLKKFFMAYRYRKEFNHHIEKLQSSIRLQAIIRGVCTARHYRIDINRVIRLQSYIRARLEYKNFQIMKKKYQWGSTCIQTLYRTYVQKNYYRALIRSAIIIQSNYRGSVVRRKVLELKAAIRIQAFIRGHHQRQVFIRINNAALRIQDIYRDLRSRDRFLLYYKELLKASLIFQANYRRIKQSKEFHLIKSAALIIQCNWRGQLARQKVVILMSTIKIQAFFRMRNAKLHLRSLLKASITLQSALRGMTGRKYVEHMKKQRCLAVLKVQSWWRMTQEMNQYKLKKASAIMIQAICRGNFARRELRKVLAVIRIQSFIRMQNQKKQFKLTKEASLTIQSIWRGQKCRDYVRKWKHERDIAITKIQSQIRMIKQRNEYDNIWKFSIKLQSMIRGILCRIGIKKMRFAIILQKFIRMQNQKKQFKLTKEASLTIQSIWRGQKCREYVEQYSRNRLKSALLIQSLYRMNKERSRLSSLKKCSMILQSAARGFLSRKQFLFTKSVRSIQSFVKMIQARNHYINVVKSAIVIQCRFRCNKFYSEFSRLKKAALVLQRKSRQLKIYRSFKKVKESSIVLQACTRGFLIRKRISEIRKNLAKEQQHRENTIVFLQKQIRSWIVHKNNLKLQAISRFRKLISRRCLTSALQKLNMNIILIQSAIRGHMVRRNLHQTQIETLRKRISENIKNIPMSETLGYKTYRALSVLKNGKYVSCIIEACSTLELASRYSLACAKYILDLNAIPKLFEVSNECNRSDPHISIINSILDIIHNILSFNELSFDVWKQYTDIPNVIIDMMCKFKDNSVTYTKAASVLLLFAKNVPQWFIERSGQTSNSINCNNLKRLSKLLQHQKKRVSMDQRARRYVTIISKTIECMRITEVLCEIFIEHSITATTAKT